MLLLSQVLPDVLLQLFLFSKISKHPLHKSHKIKKINKTAYKEI